MDGPTRAAALALARRAADPTDYVSHVKANLSALLAAAPSSGRQLTGAEIVALLSPIIAMASSSVPPGSPRGGVPSSISAPLPLEKVLLPRLRTVTAAGASLLSALFSIDEVLSVVLASLIPAPATAAGSSGSQPQQQQLQQQNVLRVSGLRKSIVAEAAPSSSSSSSSSAASHQQCIVIDDVIDGTVLLSLTSSSVAVVGCVRSTVILGPCAGHVSLDGCEGCTIIAAGAHVTVHNCSDCSLYLWASASRPLLSGDCRGLRLAPYAARYKGLLAQATATGLLPAVTGAILRRENLWDRPVDVSLLSMTSPAAAASSGQAAAVASGAGNSASGVWSLLPPSEFLFRGALPASDVAPDASQQQPAAASSSSGSDTASQLALASFVPSPQSAQQAECLPLPPAYAAEMSGRASIDASLRSDVHSVASGLAPNSAMRLQLAVQAAFKVRKLHRNSPRRLKGSRYHNTTSA